MSTFWLKLTREEIKVSIKKVIKHIKNKKKISQQLSSLFKELSFIYLFSWTRSDHRSLAVLEFTVPTRLASNFNRSSCLCHSSHEIKLHLTQ